MIRYLTFKKVLQNTDCHRNLYLCSNLYALVKETRDKKRAKKTKKQTQQPPCSNHLYKGTENAREKN